MILLTTFHLNYFFHRHQNLAELVLHSGTIDAFLQRALHGFFESGVRVNHIPFLLINRSCPIRYLTASKNPASTSHRNTAITKTNANTMPVVCSVSLRLGHTTFRVSSIDSLRKCIKLFARRRSPEHHHASHTPGDHRDTRMTIALSRSNKNPRFPQSTAVARIPT